MPQIEGLPPSPYIQVALIGGSVSDTHIDKIDAFGSYTEISKCVSLQFAQGYSRSHEELYAACEKEPNEPIGITFGDSRLLLAIRGEDAPYPSKPSVELLFTSTTEDMEANRDVISEIANQIADEFNQHFGWSSLQPDIHLNVYFREDETEAWDKFDLETLVTV